MKLLLLFILFNSVLFAQDSTKSDALKPTAIFSRKQIIKIKYPPFPLRAGFQLIKEANDGDPFAQHELGLRYITKQGFPADTVKGIYWLRKAVEQGLPPATYNYGIMLSNGIGVEWNPFEAFYNFKHSAGFGMPESEFIYGLFFTDNFVVSRNMTEAYKWIKRAADSEYEPAQKALARFEEMGLGAADDENTSSKNVYRASDEAILMEQEWELDFYEFEEDTARKVTEIGINDVFEKNVSELKNILGISRRNIEDLTDTTGIGLIKFAAEAGSPEAELLIGRGHEEGVMFEKDIIMAAERYIRAYRLGSSKAAEQLIKLLRNENFFDFLREEIENENPDAMFIWAGLAAIGFDFQLTNEQAFDLLSKAGKKNHVQAIIEIGLCYYSGRFVEMDKQKALEYWQMAADLGSKEALVRIAFTQILESGEGEKLISQINILENASEEGAVLAQTALAYCYENGLGVNKNKATAVNYYRHASQRGSETAYNSLKRIYDEIRPDDPVFIIYGD
ncbi:tetratricopeptide repeat protein [Bacteroidota bacterium]